MKNRMECIEKRYYNAKCTNFYNLNEGLIQSYNMSKVENYLKSKFPNVINVVNHAVNLYRIPSRKPIGHNTRSFEIKIYSFDNINEIIETIYKTYGWFVSVIVLNDNVAFADFDLNGRYFKVIDPYMNMEMREYIHNVLNDSVDSLSIFVEANFTVEDFRITELYHLTDKKYLPMIKKNGLVPKTHGNHTEKIYFGKNLDDIYEMVGGKFEQGSILLRLNFDEYAEEITDKYVFYKDPRKSSAVFTLDCIDPKYIQMLVNGSWVNII